MSAKQTKQATFLVLINEWLGSGSIAAMTPAEEGAYFRLCLHAAASEDGSLPDNDYELAQKSRLGEAWYAKPEKRAPKTSGERIRECFRAENGRLYQHQVDADRERYAQNVAKKKHAADARWSAKKDAHAYAPALQMHQKKDAQDMQTHTPKHANAIPSPSPSPSPSTNKTTESVSGGGGSVGTEARELPPPTEPADTEPIQQVAAWLTQAAAEVGWTGTPSVATCDRLCRVIFAETEDLGRWREFVVALHDAGRRPKPTSAPWGWYLTLTQSDFGAFVRGDA